MTLRPLHLFEYLALQEVIGWIHKHSCAQMCYRVRRRQIIGVECSYRRRKREQRKWRAAAWEAAEVWVWTDGQGVIHLNIITILIIHVNSVHQGPTVQWEDDVSTPQRGGHQGLNSLLRFFSLHSHKHHPSFTVHGITPMINSTLLSKAHPQLLFIKLFLFLGVWWCIPAQLSQNIMYMHVYSLCSEW